MTTSTPRTKAGRRHFRGLTLRHPPRAGFTLVEVMVSMTIGSLVLAGVLSTFVMMGRSSANLANYNTLDAEARRALEIFSQDVRSAKDVDWNSATPSTAANVTLTIPAVATGGANTQVTYYWDTDSSSSTYHYFCRKDGALASTSTPLILIRNVTSFSFNAYKIGGSGAATNALETKQIQLSLTATRSSRTVVSATDMVLSARFILRNKRAST